VKGYKIGTLNAVIKKEDPSVSNAFLTFFRHYSTEKHSVEHQKAFAPRGAKAFLTFYTEGVLP
jgi:hypothetical protein